MTKEEILAMRPGRELNLLVCEKVFDNKTFGSERPYSTDISAAWQAKERLNSEGLLLTLIDLCPLGVKLVRAEFWDNMGLVRSKIVGKAEGKFAPEAICKAALLAKLDRSKQ